MVMLHDANKRLLKVTDAYPEHIALAKGKHTARVQLRTDDVALLERMRSLPLVRTPA